MASTDFGRFISVSSLFVFAGADDLVVVALAPFAALSPTSVSALERGAVSALEIVSLGVDLDSADLSTLKKAGLEKGGKGTRAVPGPKNVLELFTRVDVEDDDGR